MPENANRQLRARQRTADVPGSSTTFTITSEEKPLPKPKEDAIVLEGKILESLPNARKDILRSTLGGAGELQHASVI